MTWTCRTLKLWWILYKIVNKTCFTIQSRGLWSLPVSMTSLPVAMTSLPVCLTPRLAARDSIPTRPHSPDREFSQHALRFFSHVIFAALWLVHSKNTALWLVRLYAGTLYYLYCRPQCKTTTWNGQILRCLSEERELRRVTEFLKFYFKFIAVFQIWFRDAFHCDKQSKLLKSIARFVGKI